MLIFKTRTDLMAQLYMLRLKGQTIGFVPTMGALHTGHISLIESAKKSDDKVVCSIFVNPTQFNDPSDLKKYPRTLNKDIAMLKKAGCDILFVPEVEAIYDEGVIVNEYFDFNGLDSKLEGSSRPSHFAGVAQVVKLLLEIVEPHKLYLGQKDYQQYLILSNLIKSHNLQVMTVMCPIMREENGLAMSSRNERLSEELRKNAGIIYLTLKKAASQINYVPIDEIETTAIASINQLPDFKVDYFKVLDAENLEPVNQISNVNNLIIITSVITGGVRLLDNLLIKSDDISL